jgi:hypothetical protein
VGGRKDLKRDVVLNIIVKTAIKQPPRLKARKIAGFNDLKVLGNGFKEGKSWIQLKLFKRKTEDNEGLIQLKLKVRVKPQFATQETNRKAWRNKGGKSVKDKIKG